MSDIRKKLNELYNDPDFQRICVKCEQSMFYSIINPNNGRCIGCQPTFKEIMGIPPGPNYTKPSSSSKNALRRRNKKRV